MALYNLVCAVTATPGTGSVVTGAAVAGYNNWSGVPNGAVVSYGIREKNALGVLTQSEVGIGTWNAGTSTLSRDTVRSSTNGGSKINLTTGIAEVYITAHAEDFDHDRLLNIGVTSHAVIDATLTVHASLLAIHDAHLLNTSNPHSTTAAQVGAPPNTRSISTTAPLAGGGDLSANRTLTIAQASTLLDGYLSATDWNTFNNKQAALGFTPLNPANNLSDVANVSTSRTNLGLAIGTNVQAFDATLLSIATLGTAADRMIYTTGVDTWAEATLTAFARTILDDANAAAVLTTIGAQAALGYTPVDSASASWIDLTDGGGTTLHTHAYEPIDATIVRTGQANWIDLTDGGATTLHSHAGGTGDISGTGVVGQVAEFVTNTKTIQAAKLIGPASNILTITNAAASTLALNITSAKTLTLTAADNYTLTLPESLTVAGRNVSNTFTQPQTIQGALAVAPTTNAFGTSSVYTSFVVGNITGANATNGGLYAIARFDKANEPFSALSGEDNSIRRALYFGGGGWNVPDATELNFYAAATYNETNNAGILNLKITSNLVAVSTVLTSPVATFGLLASANTPITINTAAGAVGWSHTDGTRTLQSQVTTAGGWLGMTSNHPLMFFTNNGNSRMTIGAAGGVTVLPISDTTQLTVTSHTTQTLPPVYFIDNTSATAVVRNVLKLETQSTGTAAAGLGAGLLFSIETATASTMQTAGLISTSWIDATNASRKAKMSLSAYDTAARLGIEIEASGSAAKIGFFGGTTAGKQTLNAYTSDGEGAAYTGAADGEAKLADLNQLRVAYETLRASYDDLRTKLQTSTLVA